MKEKALCPDGSMLERRAMSAGLIAFALLILLAYLYFTG